MQNRATLLTSLFISDSVLERDNRSRYPKAENQIQKVQDDEFEEMLLKHLSNLNQKSVRISLSSKLMIQLLTSIYFCLFNGVVDLGKKALKLIHNRATEMMYFDVLLVSRPGVYLQTLQWRSQCGLCFTCR